MPYRIEDHETAQTGLRRSARDAEARMATLDDLAKRYAGQLPKATVAAIREGLGGARESGRRLVVLARREPTSENLHEWRRRAKDLWYHLRPLQRPSPDTIDGQAEEAHRLADVLGDAHELSALRASVLDLDDEIAVDPEPVIGLIDHRIDELGTEALFLGGRVYAEKPRAFLRRAHRYWKAWRGGLRAASARRPAELARSTRPGGPHLRAPDPE